MAAFAETVDLPSADILSAREMSPPILEVYGGSMFICNSCFGLFLLFFKTLKTWLLPPRLPDQMLPEVLLSAIFEMFLKRTTLRLLQKHWT